MTALFATLSRVYLGVRYCLTDGNIQAYSGLRCQLSASTAGLGVHIQMNLPKRGLSGADRLHDLISNIVITANTFNMSIFSQIWLEKHGIFTEQELTAPNAIFAPGIMQIGTNGCHLLLLPERLQMTFANPEELPRQ